MATMENNPSSSNMMNFPLSVTVQVPPGLTLELWSCCRKVEHWVRLMCCPLARSLLWIFNRGWRSDVQMIRNVGVVTRTWRSEMEED